MKFNSILESGWERRERECIRVWHEEGKKKNIFWVFWVLSHMIQKETIITAYTFKEDETDKEKQ